MRVDSRLSEGLRNGTELQGVPVPAPRMRQQREVGLSSVICAPSWNVHLKGFRVGSRYRSTCLRQEISREHEPR